MAPTDAACDLEIVLLTETAIEDVLALSAEAGWNQNSRDWAMMLRLGQGFGLRAARRIIASSVALPHPPFFGWVGMVLVNRPFRRRGFATRLLKRAITHLEDLGLTPMLDATPAGRAVYLPLGFIDLEPISRWLSPGRDTVGSAPVAPIDMALVERADLAAFGADRSAILRDLAGRPNAFAMAKPNGAFLLSRAGRTATQIGPVVAESGGGAMALVDCAIDAIAGPLLIDIPDRESELNNLLTKRGFAVERPFHRMALRSGKDFGDPSRIRAIAGPELG